MTAAVLYGAKSSEDRHGSIPTQLSDCRALAAREGLDVVAEYADEAASAYRGDRGPGLARALAHAERERCALIVQHSDRLARGDGKSARHLVEVALWALKAGVTIHSCQDPQTFGDLLYAVVTGQRNHEDSARKSKAVRGGLQRRAQRGQPVGALPVGFTVEATVVGGEVITRRVVDPEGAALVERMFRLAEQGTTPGDVSRLLNAEGAVTTRAKPWTTRAVRRVLVNADYCGRNGYPALIDPERFERVRELLGERATELRRPDVRRPRGDFLLGGICRCSACGAAMRARRCSTTGRRTYRCSNAMEGRCSCDSRPVPALDAERLLVGALPYYGERLDGFLREQAAERRTEQRARETAVDKFTCQLAELERVRERHLASYRQLVADGASTAYIALEEVERLDREREALLGALGDAQAVVSEHADLGDLDAVRTLYGDLLAAVRGDVEQAVPSELAGVLRRAFAEVRIGVHDGGLLHVQGTLRVVEHEPQTLVYDQPVGRMMRW